MLVYTRNDNDLLELVTEEISHVADQAYSDNQIALYDQVMATSKDEGLLKRYVSDAISAFAARTFDICSAIQPGGLEFYVPDFDSTMEETALAEISRYVVMSACASFFIQRRVAVAQEYAERAKAAADKAVALLKSRKHPSL